MLKKTLLLSAFLGLILFLTSFREKQEPRKAVRTIIIDAGHGGKDQGAGGLHSTEAEICLAISLKLGKMIEEQIPGVKVLYTRTTDIIPGNSRDKDQGLRWRADFANSSNADLFISIHANSAGKAPGGWYERRVASYTTKTYYRGSGKKKKKVTSRVPVYETVYVENKVTGTETFIWTAKENAHKGEMVGAHTEYTSEEDSSITIPENDPLINSLKLLYTKKFFANSYRLADLVQQEFEKLGRINRGVKQRNEKGIWVLHATGMPSILVETGFISNKEEEDYLNSEAGQMELAGSITAALKAYMTQLEKSPAVISPADIPPVTGSEGVTSFLNQIEEKEKAQTAR